jgi:hypothetical protein
MCTIEKKGGGVVYLASKTPWNQVIFLPLLDYVFRLGTMSTHKYEVTKPLKEEIEYK